MKAIAIDDELDSLQKIKSFCEENEVVKLKGCFRKQEEAFDYLSENNVDLVFLNVASRAEDSFSFCRALAPSTMIVLTSDRPDYAINAFDLKAVDYLLKPYSQERFGQALKQAETWRQAIAMKPVREPEYLVVRIRYSMVKIYVDNILFVEGLDDYVKFHLNSGEVLVVRMTIKSLLEKLPSHKFMRVHRSYVVSLRHVSTIRNKVISLGEVKIRIGERFEKEFLSFFQGTAA